MALISLDDMIAAYGLPVLSGLSQPVPLLSFEANLPGFLDETMACLKQLDALDSLAVFNASTDDRGLVFDHFQSYEIFLAWFRQQGFKYAEIFCSMAIQGK